MCRKIGSEPNTTAFRPARLARYDAGMASVRALAEAIGISERRVQQLAAEQILRKKHRGESYPVELNVAAYAAWAKGHRVKECGQCGAAFSAPRQQRKRICPRCRAGSERACPGCGSALAKSKRICQGCLRARRELACCAPKPRETFACITCSKEIIRVCQRGRKPRYCDVCSPRARRSTCLRCDKPLHKAQRSTQRVCRSCLVGARRSRLLLRNARRKEARAASRRRARTPAEQRAVEREKTRERVRRSRGPEWAALQRERKLEAGRRRSESAKRAADRQRVGSAAVEPARVVADGTLSTALQARPRIQRQAAVESAFPPLDTRKSGDRARQGHPGRDRWAHIRKVDRVSRV